MTTLVEIRQQYPQYGDLSDKQLADKLYEKHYSDMPRAEFDLRVGYQPQTWGQYAGGLARQAAQGVSLGFADEAEAALRALGSARSYSDIVADIRRQNEAFARENPIASTTANIAGGVVPFVAGPGAALARLAVGSTLPRTMLRSGTLGAGLGAVGGFGAGEDGVAERLPSAATGAAFGAGLGAAAPSIIAGAGRAIGTIRPIVERLMPQRATEPLLPFSAFDSPPQPAPLGAAAVGGVPRTRFINDMTPGDIANAQTRALGAIRDAMVREGSTPAEIGAMLDEFSTWASRFNATSYGQDVVTVADLSPGLQRLLGSLARQSPEAARDIVSFLQARQTGFMPPGADVGRLGQRGIPTRQRFAEPITGEQAAEDFGAAFQRAPGGQLRTGESNLQPMGHWERSMDFLKRAFGIKDSDFHGHAANPGRTVEQLADAMKQNARRYYSAVYALGRRTDIAPAIQPVLETWSTRADMAQPPLSDAIRRAVRLFYRRDGGVQGNIKDFDLYGKQYLDDEISKAFRGGDNAIGRQLSRFRDQLFTALETSPVQAIRNIGSTYRGARAQYTDDMRVQEIVTRFRDESFKGDPRSLLSFYDTLSGEEQKLARLGVQWAAEKATGRTGERRQILDLFRNPEADRLLRGIIQRSSGGGEFATRPERFGRAIDVEALFPETRNVATGGSMTARNIQDDLMQVALDASQNVQTILGTLRGNQSLYQMVERMLGLAWDRSFGVGADAAREAVRMLLTANPAERAMMLQQVAAIMPATRMARFNDLVAQAARYTAASSAMLGGVASVPTPTTGGAGPEML